MYVCMYCVQKQKLILGWMFAAMKNHGDMFSPKILLIHMRHNAVFEDCVCMCAVWLCERWHCCDPLGRTDTNSHDCRGILQDSKLSLAPSTPLSFSLTNTLLHTPVSLSSTFLPSVSLTQAESCNSLSASHSLISNYEAGSCRSKTIAHQTWLPVPMEPVGQQMKSEVLNVARALAHVA